MSPDLRSAVAQLRRAPAHAAAVVITIALGVGATTAMFSVVDAVLLRPLPLRDPEAVVVVTPEIAGVPRGGSPGLLAGWGARSRQLRAIAGLETRDVTLVQGELAERVSALAVDGAFFSVLGMAAERGRTLTPSDDRPGAPAVAVLGDGLWRRAFAADPNVVGRTVRLDGVARSVVGVLPPAFDGVSGARDVVVPLALAPAQRENFTPYLTLVARLAPGATPATAARELDRITAELPPRAAVDGVRPLAHVVPLGREQTAAVRRPLLLMLGALAAVLLLACANAATLVLVRGVGRAREMAVRAALGASRGRLVRQLVAEQVVLGALGTAGAAGVAAGATRALVAAVPADVPRVAAASLDARALAFTAALGLLATGLCGLAPALAQRRLDVRGALQGGARGATDRRGDRARRALVGVEVALAVVLLAGAGLLLRSSAALGRVRPGFDLAHVLTARLALPTRDYPNVPDAVRQFGAVLDAARAQPGVASAALVSRVPLGGSLTSVDVAPVGAPFTRGTKLTAGLRITSADYFRSIGIPLLAGRDLRATDGATSAAVVVVNATFARRIGAATPAGAVGRRVQSDNAAFADGAGRPGALEIVGVVGDVRDGGPRAEAAPEFYAPLGQVGDEPWDYWVGREMVLVARTRGPAAAAAPALRRAVASVDARVPLYDVRTTEARVGAALAVEHFSTRLLVTLGALGLVLAAVGIHGVVAYTASQRAREVGIRLALGSTPGRAVSLVVRQCAGPVLAGTVVGGLVALVAGRAAAGLLFEVSPLDPVSVGGAVALLGVAGVAAACGPAWRTARVDPAGAMRPE